MTWHDFIRPIRMTPRLPKVRRESPRPVCPSPCNAVESHIEHSASDYAKADGQGNDHRSDAGYQEREQLDPPEPALPDADCARAKHSGAIITSRGTEVRFVSPIQGAETNVAPCSGIWSSRIRATLPIAVRQWFHFSLLRQVLVETRSLAHRISLRRDGRTVLNYAEVSQSLPQVPCSHSRNAMQFCSAGIKELSRDRPYLTLGDLRLFVQGFFLAEKWYVHRDTECRNVQQGSSAYPDNKDSMPPPAVQQSTKCDLSIPLPSQE